MSGGERGERIKQEKKNRWCFILSLSLSLFLLRNIRTAQRYSLILRIEDVESNEFAKTHFRGVAWQLIPYARDAGEICSVRMP